MTFKYTGYLQKYLPLIESGLDAGVRKDKIARDLYKVGARVWWTKSEEIAIKAMVPMIGYIARKRRGHSAETKKDKWVGWTASTPESVELEIQRERGE